MRCGSLLIPIVGCCVAIVLLLFLSINSWKSFVLSVNPRPKNTTDKVTLKLELVKYFLYIITNGCPRATIRNDVKKVLDKFQF